MPHIPLYVPDDVYDPNPAHAYKCVIEHIDAEVGRLVDTVRSLGLSDSTYVIYTSDNGPWLRFKNHGGSAGPLRDGKGTTFEGGQRVPCVMWGPGRIPAGTSTHAFTSTLDLLPTIAALSGKPLPDVNTIDGKDISSTFQSDESPRNELVFYSANGILEGIRVGDRKYLEKRARGKRGQQAAVERFLFNLADDLGERYNLIQEKPDSAEKLRQRMLTLDNEVTANARPVWTKPSP